MDVHRLDEDRAAGLRSSPYTYEAVGQSARGDWPPGFHRLERSIVLRRRDFEAAVRDLLSWQVQARSGLQVSASDIPLRVGTVVLMRIGLGRLSLPVPCRVVYVIDEPDLRGFAYGTLPGHPEMGEERFALRRHDDGTVELEISAFSRSATTLARLGGPVSRRIQVLMTERYLLALDAE